MSLIDGEIVDPAAVPIMTETAYLLRNPVNAERLLAAIERARQGEFESHDLLDA